MITAYSGINQFPAPENSSNSFCNRLNTDQPLNASSRAQIPFSINGKLVGGIEIVVGVEVIT
jgi:hypothetical protein